MIKLTMPSGIRYELPFKDVTGKQSKLRDIFQIIIAIDRKAEELKAKANPKEQL